MRARVLLVCLAVVPSAQCPWCRHPCPPPFPTHPPHPPPPTHPAPTSLLLCRHHHPQQQQRYGRALVILPYISIVNEKSEHLAAVLAPMHATVRGFSGPEERGQVLAPRWVGGWVDTREVGMVGAGCQVSAAAQARCAALVGRAHCCCQSPTRGGCRPRPHFDPTIPSAPCCPPACRPPGCVGARRWLSAPWRRPTWPSTACRQRAAWASCAAWSSTSCTWWVGVGGSGWAVCCGAGWRRRGALWRAAVRSWHGGALMMPLPLPPTLPPGCARLPCVCAGGG